jgi:hypothetical protein
VSSCVEIREPTASLGQHCGSDGLSVAIAGSRSQGVGDQAASRSRSGRSARAPQPVAYPSLGPPREAGAPERGHVSVARPNLQMHRDVVANSVGDNELTAALLLPHELEHVRVPGPDCSDGRGVAQRHSAPCSGSGRAERIRGSPGPGRDAVRGPASSIAGLALAESPRVSGYRFRAFGPSDRAIALATSGSRGHG